MHATTSGLFDGIAGLPLHPLVVHFAVVLLPLSALGLIAIIIRPRWRASLGWLVLGGLVVGTGAAYVAKESGQALATHVGVPEQHADYGDLLPILAVLLLVIAVAWFFMGRSGTLSRTLLNAVGAIGVGLSLGVMGLTVLVGHTGAEAAWAGTLDSASSGSSAADGTTGTATAQEAQARSGNPSSAVTVSGARKKTYTMADVKAHAKPSSCWTAINGSVYNVTSWISRHPGGARAIESLCGIDGTAAFTGQHGGQARPTQELKSFLLGPLKG